MRVMHRPANAQLWSRSALVLPSEVPEARFRVYAARKAQVCHLQERAVPFAEDQKVWLRVEVGHPGPV